jgi:hypothetical protein
MPLKPHPTDPDKMVYASRQYDMPDTPTARAYLQKVLDEDDDIQVYKRPWVGLTDDELLHIGVATGLERAAVEMISNKLKEKNT